MKQRNRIKLLLIGCLIIVAVSALQKIYTNWFSMRSEKPLNDIALGSLSTIVIKDNIISTSIYKKNNTWLIKKDNHEYKADETRVQTLIDTLRDIEKEDIVSVNKQKHAELGIGKQSITLKDTANTRTIYIGSTSGVSQNFIRIDDQSEVFTSSNLDTVFAFPDWRDLNISAVSDEKNVSQVHISTNDAKTALQKKNNEWYIQNKKVQAERVDYFLNDLKMLKADDILEKKDIQNIEILDVLTIDITEKNKTQKITFHKINVADYYTSGTKYNYKVKAAYVESLKKNEKDFTE